MSSGTVTLIPLIRDHYLIRKRSLAIAIIGLLLGSPSPNLRAQDDVIRLKISSHVPAAHHQHAVTFVGWGEELARRSNGRLVLEHYPSEQLGKLSQQYNLVRRGDVDIAFIMHGIPAGRFPLVELTHLPMLFQSGEQASQVLMALLPEYLAAEHRGVKVLYIFGHAPGVIHTSGRKVMEPGDLQGLRIRHPSSVIGETLRAWGASPAGMPVSELAGNLGGFEADHRRHDRHGRGARGGCALGFDGSARARVHGFERRRNRHVCRRRAAGLCRCGFRSG
jgi:TRAP-type C4-dicarboxylate transport system substrate-binding protein